MVRINGEPREAAGQSVAEILVAAGYDRRAVAVERNGAILAKADYDTTRLVAGDVVEVVCLTGGGC